MPPGRRLTAEADGLHAGPPRRTSVTGPTGTPAEALRAVRPVTTLAPASVRALQRAVGNRATTAVVARTVEPVQRQGCGGGACSCQGCGGGAEVEQDGA